MIYAFDTYYFEKKAKTVCVGFEQWEANTFSFSLHEFTPIESEYVSGQFYKRELPCLISLIKKIELQPKDILVVDGFVYLDDDKKLGLGGYLFEHFQQEYPVVGVAKNNFATLDHLKRAVTRGESKKPLFLTAAGIDVDLVADKVKQMHGDYRMPTLLSQLDQMTRQDEV